MRIIKRYTCIFKQCRSMCQDIHDKHLLYVLKKSFYRRMNLVPFHARIKKIFRGGGGPRHIYNDVTRPASPLWPKIVKYSFFTAYHHNTTFTLSNVYQIYGILLTLIPPNSIMFTVCIYFIDVFPTTEFLLSLFSLNTRFLSIEFRSIKR